MISEYKIALYVREKIAILSGINKAEMDLLTARLQLISYKCDNEVISLMSSKFLALLSASNLPLGGLKKAVSPFFNFCIHSEMLSKLILLYASSYG